MSSERNSWCTRWMTLARETKCMCHVYVSCCKGPWGTSSYKDCNLQLWRQHEGPPHIKALMEIYFIGGRRHSGCRVYMSPGPPMYTLTPIQLAIWRHHDRGTPSYKSPHLYFICGRRHHGCRAMSPGPPTPHSYPICNMRALLILNIYVLLNVLCKGSEWKWKT